MLKTLLSFNIDDKQRNSIIWSFFERIINAIKLIPGFADKVITIEQIITLDNVIYKSDNVVETYKEIKSSQKYNEQTKNFKYEYEIKEKNIKYNEQNFMNIKTNNTQRITEIRGINWETFKTLESYNIHINKEKNDKYIVA